MKKESKREEKYNIVFNDKDFVDTSKYDNVSLKELNKMIKKQEENYTNYLKNNANKEKSNKMK